MRDLLRRALPLALLFALLLPSIGSSQWKKQSAYPGTFFNEVFFIDPLHGWLTQHAGIVVRTTDGGTSWQQANLPGSVGSFNRDICFVSTQIGYVSGDDGIWKTIDGGATWTNITPPNAPVTGNSSNWFIDANTGVYAFGACSGTVVRFYRTTNGGTTWDSVQYTQPTDVAVGGICYANGTYYAAGGVGNFWKSTDGGATWTQSSTGSAGFAEDAITAGGAIHLASVDGSVCGVSGSGKTSRSTDGGNTWQSVAFPGVLMWGVSLYTPQEGWSCGDGGHAYKTTDGGATWTEKSCGIARTDRLDDIHFTDPTHGWAVGDGIYKYVGDYYTKLPDTIDFGDIIVGTASADSNARVTAVGGGLTVNNRVLAGPNFNEFQAPNGLGPQNIASCVEGLTPIRFMPTSEGVKVAQLEYTIAGYPETPVVYLKGRGVRPRITSPTSLTFDTLLCDATKLDTIFIRNTGSSTLKITAASTAGLAGGSFRLVSPLPPVTIAPGDSVPFIVEATLTSPGQLTGSLALTNNDPEINKSPWAISLFAYKRKVAVAFDHDTLIVIPSAPFGAKSTACIEYRNSGDGLQTILGVAPTAGDPIITHTPQILNYRVGKGLAQQICFSASATDTFVHTRRFKISTDPCGIDTFVTVRYQALNPVIFSSSIWLLTAGACDTNANDAILITNKGNAPLILDRPTFGGADGSGFSLTGSPTWPDTIPPGGTRLVRIAFTFPPGGSGSHTGTITFPNNDGLPGKKDWTVTLTVTRGSSELAIARKVIDVGDICLKDGRVEWAYFTNVGTAPAVIRALDTLTASSAVTVASTPVGAALAPKSGDSIAFSVVPRAIGPFRASYVVRYDPCSRLDTITIVGRGVGIELDATPPAINYGIVRAGAAETRTFKLTNNGNIDATVRRWDLAPAIAGARVTSPSLPLTLKAGESIDVTIEMTPPDTGRYELALSAIGEGTCPDTMRATVEAIAIRGAVTTNTFRIDFGSIASCDTATAADSLTLTNKGTTPIRVKTIRLAKGSASSFTFNPAAPAPGDIGPGGSLPIMVDIIPSASGDISDTLIIELDDAEQPVIAIPLAARRDRADLAIRDDAGASIATLAFETLTACDNDARAAIHLTNNGTVTDTITIGLAGASFSLLSPSSILLAPGGDTTITLSATMSAPGTDAGTLTIRSVPCALGGTVGLRAEYMTSAASISSIDFQSVVVGTQMEKESAIANNGSADQVIDTLYIEGPAGDFTLIGNYEGMRIAKGDTLAVKVGYLPASVGAAGGRLVVVTSAPCADTIFATIAGAGVKDELYPIHLTGGSARGRWGTTVRVPIAFENRRAAPIGSFDLDVTASADLLDPRDAAFNGAPVAGWMITRKGFEAATGTLTLHFEAGDGAAILPSTDSLFSVEYLVLRGGEIASDLKLAVKNAAPNVTATTQAGSFALEDYCDAHGRLLHVQGSVALEQNVPNPFNPETIIEFETAFQGRVTLAVYDGLGREVMRPVDEDLPAGRRRVRFDARDLPSGVYTYKLVTGLQVLSRQMVVTK